MTAMQTRRCRTCSTRQPIGNYPPLDRRRRSWTCRTCTTDTRCDIPAKAIPADVTPTQLGPLSPSVPVRLTPTCGNCGPLHDLTTTVHMPPELIGASQAADLLICAAVHRCNGRLTVDVA